MRRCPVRAMWLLALLLAACGGNQPDEQARVRAAQATAQAIVARANATAAALQDTARRPTAPPTREPVPTITPTAAPTRTPVPTPTPPSTATPAFTSTPTPAPTATAEPENPVEELQKATVQVLVDGDEGAQISGSGSVVSADGLILTNAHVLYDGDADALYDASGEATISVTTDPRQPAEPRYTARVVQLDEEADVAVLKVTALYDGSRLPRNFRMPAVFRVADSDRVEIGDALQVFGFPGVGGGSVTFTRGVVSGFLPYGDASLIKTDAQFTHGSSGGSAVNEAGELVGVPTAGIVDDAGRVGYIVPVNSARALLRRAAAGQVAALVPEPDAPAPEPPPTPDDRGRSGENPDDAEEGRFVTLYVDAEPLGFTGANVRAEPSTEAELVGELSNGDSIRGRRETVTGADGEEWYQVVYEGRTAYILGALLRRMPPGTGGVPEEEDDPPAPPSEDQDARRGPVRILSDSAYTDDVDYTHVVGEVKNGTDGPVEFVEITATFYDRAGRVVATEYTYSALDIIPAGGTSPFEILKDIPARWERYTLNLEYEEAEEDPPGGLKLVSSSDYVDDIAFTHIVGEVRNTGRTRLEYVEVIATFYNRRGTVIGTSYTYTSPENLRPGQTAPFEIILTETEFAGAEYTLQLQASAA